jgi:hypothetical protein
MAAVSNCVFCKRNEPHEKHLTLLEYTRIFGEYDAYNSVLGKSVAHLVVTGSAVKRIA